jgi:hypothetical protein
MAPTPDGDLWVWLAEFPVTESLDGKTLAYYDSDSGEWTVYEEEGTPEGGVRTMTTSEEGVWLTMFGDTSWPPGIWQFDGQNWIRNLANTGANQEILDIAAAPDGTIWFIQDHDHALYQLEP